MAEEFKLTRDTLVKGELDGKTAAIARYDEILWKIRSGYAVILYGAVGVISTLVINEKITLNFRTALSVTVLVVGFSLFGAIMDYCFMCAKLRVVSYRDRLIELTYAMVTSEASSVNNGELLQCLKNSGERKEHIHWADKVGRSIPLLYYGGTGLFCTIATLLLTV
jgi:hypothetical protein